MIRQPPAALKAAVLKSKPASDPDATARLREAVTKARGIQTNIEDLEIQIAAQKADLNKMFREELPDLMDAIGSLSIELAGDGNQPNFVAKLVPYYHANISAKWEAEKRKRAFDWLEANGHGDLIKTNVAVPFRREDRKKAVAFAEKNKELGPIVKEEVHFGTLTSWLREQVEEKNTLPPLDLIGGDVGRVVEIKPVKIK